jgi:hypothetical protein
MYATAPTSTTRVQRHQLLSYIGSTSTLLSVATTPCAVARLVVRSHWLYFKYTVRRDYLLPAASALRQLCRSRDYLSAGYNGSTSTTSRVRMPRLVARLVVDNFASCRLLVDYSAYAARPGASARRAARHRLLRAPRLRLAPHCLYFSHAVRRDYLSRGNTGSTSSTLRTATTSSSGCIALTIHLD